MWGSEGSVDSSLGAGGEERKRATGKRGRTEGGDGRTEGRKAGDDDVTASLSARELRASKAARKLAAGFPSSRAPMASRKQFVPRIV